MGPVYTPRSLFQLPSFLDRYKCTKYHTRCLYHPSADAHGVEYQDNNNEESWPNLCLPTQHVVSSSQICKHNIQQLIHLDSATLISIFRAKANASFHNTDPTWDMIPVMIWSTIESTVGVVCCCLPVLAPLVKLCFGRRAEPNPGVSKERSSASVRRSRPYDRNGIRFEDRETEDLVHPGESNSMRLHTSVDSGVDNGSALELGPIRVLTDIDLESARKV